MKRGMIFFLTIILLTSLASAEIIINQQPQSKYNLGDTIEIPVTIKSASGMTGILKIDLICSGQETNFYRNGIKILPGEEKKISASLILTIEQLGTMRGNCIIKAMIFSDYAISNDFTISDKISISIENLKTVFNPGEEVIIEGTAIKYNDENSNGFLSVEINLVNTTSIYLIESINKGHFLAKVPLPKNTKAGSYLVNLRAYEIDEQDQETNTGITNYNIEINQIPTSLEIIFEEDEIMPGTNLKTKTILHDQTGESIPASAIITIKDNDNTILEQQEISTEKFLSFALPYNQPPAKWKVVAVSNKLTAESTFTIKEKKEVKIEIVNSTLIITNIGNTYYNETVIVKIANQTINIPTKLEIDCVQKYSLTAPDGEYQVEVIVKGESKKNETVSLTGKAIEIEKVSEGFVKIIKYPIVWIFIIIVLGLTAFIIFRKGLKKSFISKINLNTLKRKNQKEVPLSKNSLVNTQSKAELSLSIKGDKQNVSSVCLKIKNLGEIQSQKGNAEETLQKIVRLAESKKGVIYESQDNIFFIFAPTKTKTLANEKSAIDFAESAREYLKNHNKLFKQKIDFGISINYGTIVGKQEQESFKFMSMGTLVTIAKKTASLSKGDIFLGEKFKEKLGSNVKTQKHEEGKTIYYTIKQIVNREEHSAFIRNFLDKIEGKK